MWATTDAAWAVTASTHAVQEKCGLFHPLCGLSHPLCMLHMCYVGCYWRGVGCYILYGGYCSLHACCTGAMWHVSSSMCAVPASMWAVASTNRERIHATKTLHSANVPCTCPSLIIRVHVGLRFDPPLAKPFDPAKGQHVQCAQITPEGRHELAYA